MRAGSLLLLALLLAIGLPPAPNLRAAFGASQPAAATLFDEIADARERTAFRQLWNTAEPSAQRDRAVRFVEQYPRSTLLREAYELAARASVAAGDLATTSSRCRRWSPTPNIRWGSTAFPG